MTDNEFLAALVKAFNAGREFAKKYEIPDSFKNEIEDAYPQDYEIIAILDRKGITTI